MQEMEYVTFAQALRVKFYLFGGVCVSSVKLWVGWGDLLTIKTFLLSFIESYAAW